MDTDSTMLVDTASRSAVLIGKCDVDSGDAVRKKPGQRSRQVPYDGIMENVGVDFGLGQVMEMCIGSSCFLLGTTGFQPVANCK